MAPPSRYPVLRDINPETFSASIADAVAKWMSRLAIHMTPAASLNWLPDTGTDLEMTTLDLARYACSGVPLDGDLDDYIYPVVEATLASALGAVDLQDLADDTDPRTELGLVVRAAQARQKLDATEPVSQSEVALLSSLSSHRVQVLEKSGDLPARAAEEGRRVLYDARAIKKWLAGRGVSGF